MVVFTENPFDDSILNLNAILQDNSSTLGVMNVESVDPKAISVFPTIGLTFLNAEEERVSIGTNQVKSIFDIDMRAILYLRKFSEVEGERELRSRLWDLATVIQTNITLNGILSSYGGGEGMKVTGSKPANVFKGNDLIRAGFVDCTLNMIVRRNFI